MFLKIVSSKYIKFGVLVCLFYINILIIIVRSLFIMFVIVNVVVEMVFCVVNLKKLIVNLNMYDNLIVIMDIVFWNDVLVMLLYFFMVI